MKRTLLTLGILALIIYACNQQAARKSNSLLQASNLLSQFVSVDITKDTTLVTKKGAVIKIPKGALSTNGTTTVQLEIKEAYNIREMILAGLTTQSNGQPLRSGGMIYINAVGENTVKITQALSVAIPTSYIDNEMQLYKGEKMEDSSVNWTDPKPLPSNAQIEALNVGRSLFNTSCASCHSIGKVLTAPDLAYVWNRTPLVGGGEVAALNPYANDSVVLFNDGKNIHTAGELRKETLYAYTKNNQPFYQNSPYYRCLKKRYNNSAMNNFPNLTNVDLDRLYAYIDNETKTKHLPDPGNPIRKCYDSCSKYEWVKNNLETIKARLMRDSNYLVEIDRGNNINPVPPSNNVSPNNVAPPDVNFVSPVESKSLYYQFKVDFFGWFNVDALYHIGQDCQLMVRARGQYKVEFNIYLVIPEYKVLLAGGHLKNEKNAYGFDKDDGSIPLPQGVQAYIIAMGEYKDQIIFAEKSFSAQQKQEIEIQLNTVTKEEFQKQINSLPLGDLKMEVNDSKTAGELKKVISDLKNAEKLKPMNCDCDCFKLPISDTTQAAPIERSTNAISVDKKG